MPKESNPNVQLMQQSLENRTFGKTVIEGLDNIPKTKTAIMIKLSELYSAPVKWNFYDKLDDNKLSELMDSIEENGLLEPIIVWDVDFETIEDEYGDEIDKYDFDGNKYCLLSGHNRTFAYKKLYEATNDDKYLTIPAFIFKNEEIDILQAKEIVIDANYVQRVLNTKEMEMSIMYKYDEIERNKERKGRTRDIVANELGISSAKVEHYRKLHSIIQPLKDMVYEDKIALTSILKIADKSTEIQKFIYTEYGDVLSNKLLNKVKPYMAKKDEIKKVFDKELTPKVKKKKVSVEVPEDLIDEFKEMAYQWIYNKTKRE